MSKKYYAVYPGQIKIDNEAFFGIDYKITDFINELMEQCKQQKEVIDKIYELIKQHIRKDGFLELNEWQTRDLLDLLKEVSK